MKRRRFVSLAARASALVAASRLPAAGATLAPGSGESRLAGLRAAIDAILPAQGGMPAASGAGALESLERRRSEDPAFATALDAALAWLDRACAESAGVAFRDAGPGERVAALRDLEAGEPALFGELRDGTYEAYYTRPDVWRRIGYEHRTSDEPGERPPAFDEAVLERVRRLPPLYRTDEP